MPKGKTVTKVVSTVSNSTSNNMITDPEHKGFLEALKGHVKSGENDMEVINKDLMNQGYMIAPSALQHKFDSLTTVHLENQVKQDQIEGKRLQETRDAQIKSGEIIPAGSDTTNVEQEVNKPAAKPLRPYEDEFQKQYKGDPKNYEAAYGAFSKMKSTPKKIVNKIIK